MPHRSCERSRDQVVALTSISSTSRLVSSKSPPEAESGDMASILRAECTTLGLVPLLPFVQQMKPLPVAIFHVKSFGVCSKFRFSAFFLGVPCARFLVCPIINNTITKNSFSVAFLYFSKEQLMWPVLKGPKGPNQPWRLLSKQSNQS